MDVTYTCNLTLANLWDPFVLSGPVRASENTFVSWYMQLEDVTSNVPLQPEWWPGEPPYDCVCGKPDGPGGCYSGQIWKVTIIADLVPGGYRETSGWFYVCHPESPTGSSSYSAAFSVTVTDVDQLSVCQYEVTEASAYTVRFENCMDENGDPVVLEIAAGLIPGFEVGDMLTIGGTFETCLHKGSAENNYVTQAMACNVYALDFSEWEEFFCGGDARGYGDEAVAYWEAINDFVADGCAAEQWVCILRRARDLVQWAGPDGLLHVYMVGPAVVHWWRDIHAAWYNKEVIEGDFSVIYGWPEAAGRADTHVVIVEDAEDGPRVRAFRGYGHGQAGRWEEYMMPWITELISAADAPDRGESVILGYDEEADPADGRVLLRRIVRGAESTTWSTAYPLVNRDGVPVPDLMPGDLQYHPSGGLVLIACRRDSGALLRVCSTNGGLTWEVEEAPG